jgi:DNA repair exonuclease SbcCD nuclease subunit
LVPGNHERSRIPYPMLALHPRIYVFDRPRTFVVRMSGVEVALAGFPYHRNGVRTSFAALLGRTGGADASADLCLLCVHQAFEGATVGPSDYTFRSGEGVVRLADVPQRFAAVLSGHIHRHQIVTRDLHGAVLRVPVLYPGSIERTSFAEMHEAKGFLLLDFQPVDSSGWLLSAWEFRELPTRPMLVADIEAASQRATVESQIRDIIDRTPVDAILRIRIHGFTDASTQTLIRADHLRALAPYAMNIEAVLVDQRGWAGRRRNYGVSRVETE